jgi:hypothetical protein
MTYAPHVMSHLANLEFLLALAPFIASAVIDRLIGSAEGLAVGAVRLHNAKL